MPTSNHLDHSCRVHCTNQMAIGYNEIWTAYSNKVFTNAMQWSEALRHCAPGTSHWNPVQRTCSQDIAQARKRTAQVGVAWPMYQENEEIILSNLQPEKTWFWTGVACNALMKALDLYQLVADVGWGLQDLPSPNAVIRVSSRHRHWLLSLERANRQLHSSKWRDPKHSPYSP